MIKTTAKIALILFFCTLSTVLGLAGAVYYLLDNYSYADFYKRLETRATIAAKYNFDSTSQDAETMRKLRSQYLERLPDERDYIFTGRSVYELTSSERHSNIPQSFLIEIWQNGKAVLKIDNTFYAGINHSRNGVGHIVIVSADNYFASHHMSFLQNVLLACVIFAILIAAGTSLYFSRNVFAPIRDITEKVRKISTDNIHQRLAHSDAKSEIGLLSSTFNELLARIETALETQKNFIGNASHELGTPLTAIIGEADVALLKPRSAEEYQETLRNILDRADRLDQITKSLLFLARAGYKGKNDSFERTRIDELAWQVSDTIKALNPETDIRIDSSLFPEDPTKLKVYANIQLLHLALANIVGNACKYSHNKPVVISIAASQGHVVLIIQDQGIGIPENELQFIYDPFFRASNTAFFDGYGIGLPLARNIVHLHSGQILVTSMLGRGTTVQITLPLV